ncbi:unnamed protein product (mitochondrion) [Plasmodiophora brassicae]|uniref:Uncharacterized protein n=1 Tax=Plasmodiophora brassicae TaxID=37360 RepID=A0A0G4ILW1_PLABS|nr:hypothetical protein PBRA_004824 [Plasmodiophora brassicae]SPQ93321.1 unnamed protein product [Plasmodiophora brassicae]
MLYRQTGADRRWKRRRALMAGLAVICGAMLAVQVWLGQGLDSLPIGFVSRSPAIWPFLCHYRLNQTFPFVEERVPDYLQRIAPRMQAARSSTIPTIFVAVPSYRDDDCPETINNLFRRAHRPDLVTVGLVDQIAGKVDRPCIDGVDERWKARIRLVERDARVSDGPNTARYLASKLWDGERYYFSVDAHTRFIQNWDAILLNMMGRLPANAIVTHYPVAEETSLGDNGGAIPWLCKGHFGGGAPPGLIMQECGECHERNRLPAETSCVGTFLGAGFFFGSSRILSAAPPDRYLGRLFQGEELLLAARLWTSGFEFYAPTTNVGAHRYGGRAHNVFWENDPSDLAAQKERTMARVYYLLGQTQQRPEKDDEIDYLGMGTVYPLDDYLEFAGLDFANGVQTSRCDSRFDRQTRQWVPASVR